MSEELQKELETVREALKKANAEAKQHREAKEALEKRVGDLESDDTLAKYRARIVATETKSRLLAEGVKDPDRIVKYIKAEDVKVTDDGLEGLDDVLGTVKKDFPELFDKKRQVGGSADAGATGDAPKRSASELQIARALGKV
jgi:predicted  nucleic acid-binding Zn-ribbon protein